VSPPNNVKQTHGLRDHALNSYRVNPSSSAESRADVVFTFAYEMLDDAIGREFCRPIDQTLLALARDERVGKLLTADPWRSYVLSAARRRSVRFDEPTTVAGREVIRVRPHRLRREDATDLAAVERSYRRYGALLGRALARARGERVPQPRSAALVTDHPFVGAFCEAPWISKVVFIGRDDWATGEGVAQWWDLYREAYKRIDNRCPDIFAVSEELASRMSSHASVVASGVNADLWRRRYPAPARIAALPGPRAIYTGTIDDRLLPELVEITARTVGSLIFLGYPGDAGVIQWLRSLDNVHVLDAVGQQELAATVQACDVGVIPHRDQDCVRAMSPLKLYEYLAAGLPAVSVDLPPVHGVDDERVLICGPEDWADGLKAAVAAGPASEARRQQFIDGASWERRMSVVVDAAVG
jgi:teichuronic acid biosynthesis glycosyltransferase TuaH